jgi:glutathione S-transferase
MQPITQQAPLRLYYSPGACSLAAHIVLEETGLPYERQIVSSRTGETQSEAWLKVNPKGRVPALGGVPGHAGGQDGILTEVTAIMVYLARLRPEVGLLPEDPVPLVRCLEWINWLTGSVHAMSYAQIWRPQRFADDPALHDAISAKGGRNVREQYAYIEHLLSDGRAFAVAGAGYSIADPFLLVFHRWGSRIGLDMAKDYPSWQRVSERVMALPAVQRILAVEGLLRQPETAQ